MKTPTTTKLDTSTPKWPLLAVNLTDPTVDINGASTPLDLRWTLLGGDRNTFERGHQGL